MLSTNFHNDDVPFLPNGFKAMLVLLLCAHIGYGQHSMAGKVLDESSKNPLEKVHIFLTKHTDIGTTTDDKGFFSLHITAATFKETDSITFSIIGYKTLKTTIASLKALSNIVYMAKDSSLLEEVKLTVLKKPRLQLQIKYEKVTSLRTRIFSFASIIVNNKLYISGGDKTVVDDTFLEAMVRASEGGPPPPFEEVLRLWKPSGSFKAYSDKLFIYDLNTDTWQKPQSKFENRAYHQINYYNNELYILGGKRLSNNKTTEYLHDHIEIFNVNEDTLKIDHTNPHQAVNSASFVYKNNLIIMGGSLGIDQNGNKIYTDKIHSYNMESGYWYDLGNMTVPKETSGVLCGNKIYLIGGFENKPISTIESYDLISGKWTLEGELFYGLEKPALTCYKDIIYIYHYGKLITYNIKFKALQSYDIALFVKNVNMHFFNDALYIVGGYRETRTTTNPSSDIFKIDLSEFKKTKAMDLKNIISI